MSLDTEIYKCNGKAATNLGHLVEPKAYCSNQYGSLQLFRQYTPMQQWDIDQVCQRSWIVSIYAAFVASLASRAKNSQCPDLHTCWPFDHEYTAAPGCITKMFSVHTAWKPCSSKERFGKIYQLTAMNRHNMLQRSSKMHPKKRNLDRKYTSVVPPQDK